MDKELLQRIVTPLGYKRINWSQVMPRHKVYIQAKRGGQDWAYGPFTVKDVPKRILLTAQKQEYAHKGTVLLLPIAKATGDI